MIIHVVDASNPQWEKQMQIVYQTLEQLGVSGKKRITLFNKQDKVTERELFRDLRADRALKVSVKTGGHGGFSGDVGENSAGG